MDIRYIGIKMESQLFKKLKIRTIESDMSLNDYLLRLIKKDLGENLEETKNNGIAQALTKPRDRY